MHATLHPALSVRWSVGRLVGPHFTFWAAAPKGTKSCRTQGKSVRPSVRPSVRTSVRTSVPPSRAQEPGRQALDPAGQASEPARHSSEPASQASEPANQASEPANQASEAARQASEPVSQASEALRPAWLALRPGWMGLRPAWLALGPSRGDGPMYVWMYVQTDGKSPHSSGLCPLSGLLPKNDGVTRRQEASYGQRYPCPTLYQVSKKTCQNPILCSRHSWAVPRQ